VIAVSTVAVWNKSGAAAAEKCVKLFNWFNCTAVKSVCVVAVR